MNNNAIITTTLEDLLNIMDARAYITIYIKSEKGELAQGSMKVYELLTRYELMEKWGRCHVVGLSTFGNCASILIKSEEA